MRILFGILLAIVFQWIGCSDTGTNNSGDTTPSPFVSRIEPDSARYGEQIGVYGEKFSSTAGVSEIRIGGVAVLPVRWTDTLIAANIPFGISDGRVNVIINGVSSNVVSFRLLTGVSPLVPTLIGVSQDTVTPGDIVNLSGRSFGATQGSNGVRCAGLEVTVVSWSDTSIGFLAPQWFGVADIVVRVGSSLSNSLSITIHAPISLPEITSLVPASGRVGDQVVLHGTSFGTVQANVFFQSLAAPINTWTPTRIEVSVPSGATSGPVTVRTAAGTSNGVHFSVATTGPIPVITDVDPNPASVGDRLRIHGNNFGPETPVVTISGVVAPIDEVEPGEIRVYVPSNAVTGPLVVTVGGRSSDPYPLTITGTTGGSLTVSEPAVTIPVGGIRSLSISGGTPPYSVYTAPNGTIATASVSGAALMITGVSAGGTSVSVRDNANPFETVTVGITVTSGGGGVSFSQQIQPVFDANCTSCHGGSGGLYLTQGNSYSNLVNVTAQEGCVTEKRVNPGSPSTSVLFKRINGTSCGARMPKGGAPLSAQEIQLIQDWILQGALNN